MNDERKKWKTQNHRTKVEQNAPQKIDRAEVQDPGKETLGGHETCR